jgi:hypothetical protein
LPNFEGSRFVFEETTVLADLLMGAWVRACGSKNLKVMSNWFGVFSIPSLVFACWVQPGCKSPSNPINLPSLLKDSVPCSPAQKITSIYRDHVYDLSGYADGNGNPFNLFDENALVDPGSPSDGANNYIPQTNPQPLQHQAIYFPEQKGNRIVADLLVPYKLTQIYIYDRSHDEDSVWVYTGDMRHWRLRAAFESLGNPGQWGWRKFSILDSSRFIMIRFSSYETNITEAVLYGCPYGPLPSAPSAPVMQDQFTHKMMKDFLGVNCVTENDMQWLKPFHYTRMYNFALDFDNDLLHDFPAVQFNMLHYGYWNKEEGKYHFDIDGIKDLNKAEVWYSIRGVPLWMSKKGFTDKDRPVTVPGMDPEDPMSYARHAAMMWNLAAFFGANKVDTNLLSLSHSPRQSGRGSMSVFENGNEEDADWVGSKYCSPLDYFAQSSADYDGDQGRMGPGHGIINADPGSRLMTSGMIELDTNRVRTYKFLCNSLRTDSAFLWKGGIQYHHYSTDMKKGLSPEEDSLRWRLSKVREATYRIEPKVECILGENGYDKSSASRQGAPVLPGISPTQSQGIFILRSINATAFSGFDAYVLFWLRDYGSTTDPNPYATCGIVGPLEGGKSGTRAFPAWYYISTFENWLGSYSPDSILSEKGNAWIYKYRSKRDPDSVCYFVYSPSRNGTKVKDFPLHLGEIVNKEAIQVNFSDAGLWGEQAKKKVTDGVLSIDVEEKPSLILVKEKR